MNDYVYVVLETIWNKYDNGFDDNKTSNIIGVYTTIEKAQNKTISWNKVKFDALSEPELKKMKAELSFLERLIIKKIIYYPF